MTIPFHQSVVCPILIGRSAELSALQECIEAAARGQGFVVLLCGEAGIGKSRLTAELRRLAETQDFQLLAGRCFPTDRACPYAPLLDLLGAFLAPRSPSQIATTLGSSARALVPLLPEQVQHLPELASLSHLFPLDPEQEQRRLFEALAEVFLRATTSRPLLLVIEDLHWSDENTLEFLLFFARKTAGRRLLMLLTYRNDETHQPLRSLLAQFDRERQRQEMILEPLSRANTETFLQTILQGTRSLPAGMLASFGKLDAGLAHGQQGLHLAMEMNHQQWIAGAHYTLASIYLSLLDPEQALTHGEIGLKAARALGSAIWITNLSADLIQAYMALDKLELAEAMLQEVRSGAENPLLVAERQLLLVWAELALKLQLPKLALERCEQLLSTAPQQAGEKAEYVIPRLWKCQGEALAALDRVEEAIQVLKEARRGAKMQEYLPLLWQIERSLGRAYQKQRRSEEAQQAYDSARQGIDLLARNIEDPIQRSHFEQAAYATLPKEKPISSRQATANQYDGLSERELEVAALIGQGKSNAEMAELLIVSKRTVETYVSRVLSKLGLTSRSQIALWTRDKGLASSETSRGALS